MGILDNLTCIIITIFSPIELKFCRYTALVYRLLYNNYYMKVCYLGISSSIGTVIIFDQQILKYFEDDIV